jgi:hypothetical protein
MEWLFDWNITKWNFLYWFTFQKFVSGIQYMMYHEMRNLFFENLNHLIITDFWMIKIGPYFHKSLWVAICFFQFFCPKRIFFKVLLGALFIWTLWVIFLGLSNWKMTSTFVNVSVDINLWGFLGEWTCIS